MSPAAENNKATTSTLNTAVHHSKIKLKVVKAATKVNAKKRIAMLEDETTKNQETILALQKELQRLQNEKMTKHTTMKSIRSVQP
eukprot:UN01277